MAELNITVRDRHGQAASQKVAVDVTPTAPARAAPAPSAPAAPSAPPREAAPPRRAAPPADIAAPARYTEGLKAPPRRVSHMRGRRPRGQILVQAGLLSEAQLERALQQQKQTGERLGRVILSMGLASQDDIARAIAKQLSIDFYNLSDALLEEDILLRIPEQIARRHHVIPIAVEDGSLVLGMEDPLDVVALDDLRKLTGLEIRPAVITPGAFHPHRLGGEGVHAHPGQAGRLRRHREARPAAGGPPALRARHLPAPRYHPPPGPHRQREDDQPLRQRPALVPAAGPGHHHGGRDPG